MLVERAVVMTVVVVVVVAKYENGNQKTELIVRVRLFGMIRIRLDRRVHI